MFMAIGVILLSISLMLTSINGLRRISFYKVARYRHFAVNTAEVEYLLVPEGRDASSCMAVAHLQSSRPELKLIHQIQTNDMSFGDPVAYMWSAFRDGLQLDATLLYPHFLGKYQLSDEETAAKWTADITQRLEFVRNPQSLPCIYGGDALLGKELQTAISIVQRSAFLIRSLQKKLLSQADFSGETKDDKTPVTVADLSVQALIIDTLSMAFPNDRFIAEEDSGLVRTNADIRNTVLSILRSATGDAWSADRLYAALDKGSRDCLKTTNVEQRVWVLDPIDGTKGFLRGEHCCTGLGLLIDGKTVLSVLGCPNLNLQRLLEREGSAVVNIGAIDSPLLTDSHDIPEIPHPDCGSIYYAVTGQGAFARTLAMPLGAAYEVTTSGVTDASRAVLCESAEAAFGDGRVSARTSQLLGATSDFVRIDGMCKHCVVGVGAAEATLRLPPSGYREKIWDHVAGEHFVREAGGRVTDLRGRALSFERVSRAGEGAGQGGSGDEERELDASVEGVVVSNGPLHESILAAVVQARAEKAAAPV